MPSSRFVQITRNVPAPPLTLKTISAVHGADGCSDASEALDTYWLVPFSVTPNALASTSSGEVACSVGEPW